MTVLFTITWKMDSVFFSIGSMPIRYYGLCWVLGLVLGYAVVRYFWKREALNVAHLDSLTMYVFIGCLAGARLGHCLFYDFDYFSHHLLEIVLPVSFTPSGVKLTGYAGLASHGGAIGLIAAILLFCRKFHYPSLFVLDKIALVAPLSGAFIRLGNFFNSEILGAPSSLPWAMIFTNVDNIPRHPAQLYEAVCYLLIFMFLFISYYRHHGKHANGYYFGLSVLCIFTVRFFIEFVKEVQEPFEITLRHAVGLDMGQLLSVPFILLGIVFIIKYFDYENEKLT